MKGAPKDTQTCNKVGWQAGGGVWQTKKTSYVKGKNLQPGNRGKGSSSDYSVIGILNNKKENSSKINRSAKGNAVCDAKMKVTGARPQRTEPALKGRLKSVAGKKKMAPRRTTEVWGGENRDVSTCN